MPTNRDRVISTRVDKLDSDERLIERKEDVLLSGRVDCSPGSVRRKATFDLGERLPSDWQSRRWKLWYGYQGRDDASPIYVPLGVFIPVGPRETRQQGAYTSNYQAIDKSRIWSDYELPAPMDWSSGTSVASIIQDLAAIVGETNLSIASDLGNIAANFTFEEQTSLLQIMDTLMSGRNAEWFYDVNGVLVARRQVDAEIKTPVLVTDPSDPIEIEREYEIEDDDYYNSVTVIGGKADTDIFRSTLQDQEAIERAGGRIVHRTFKHEGAVTQTDTDAIAAFYLSRSVRLPFTISMKNLVEPSIEPGDVIQRIDRKFEAKWFSIPLGIDLQTIKGGEIL